ncbi:MAG: hypothetical protein IT208_15855 [Chthonomonadales bacterium]|nr:hypothetical protein [Chthonomonadales bacterium]
MEHRWRWGLGADRPAPVALLIGCAVCLSARTAAGTAARPTHDRADAPAYESAAFKRTISQDVVGTPLGDLLDTLSGDNVRLTASRSCRDLKIHARIANRPLADVMKALAELVPGAWKQEGGPRSWSLVMDPKWIARRARWWNLYETARQYGLNALRRAMAEEIGRPFDERTETSNPEARADLRQTHEFFRGLPDALRERILDRLNDAPFYRSFIGFSGADNEIRTAVPLRDLDAEGQGILASRLRATLHPPPDAAALDAAVVVITNGGFVVNAAVVVPGRGTNHAFMMNCPWPTEGMALSLDHRHLPEIAERLGKATPAVWEPFLEFQRSRVWPCEDPTGPVRRVHPPRRRAETLAHIANSSGIDFIADYYSTPGTPMQPSERKARLLGEPGANLDTWAYVQDSSWKRRPDGIYLMRDNRWYRDDALEVPAELIKRWSARKAAIAKRVRPLAPLEALRERLDWEAEVVAALSRYQISSGLQWIAAPPAEPSEESLPEPTAVMMRSVLPFRDDAERIQQEYWTVRLYGSLNAGQRAALIEGRLPAVALSAPQYELAVSLAPGLAGLAPRDAVLGLSNPSDGGPGRDRVRLAAAPPDR